MCAAIIPTTRAITTAFQTSPTSIPVEYNTADYVQTPLPDKQQIYSLTLTQDVKFATLTATGSFYKRNFGFFRDNTWAVISLGLGPAALQGTPNCFKNAGQPRMRPRVFAATCSRN